MNEALKALLWMHLLRLSIIKGLWFPNTKVNLAEGQYEQSIQDTIDVKSETYIYEVGVKDSIHYEMLESIMPCSLPMGTLDVPFLDDSSDLGSLKEQGANGLRDGDPGDLQPDHVCKSWIDRGMMMNANEWEHVRNTCRTRAEHVRNMLGIEPRCLVLW